MSSAAALTSGAASNQTLERMLHQYPLGPSWGRPLLFTETVVIGSTRIHLCGLATSGTEEVTGSAGDISVNPFRRAYFELLERMSILEAIADPTRVFCLLDRSRNVIGVRQSAEVFPRSVSEDFSYGRSNGVAASSDWDQACDGALWELIERDCVLRSWYGQTRPSRVPLACSQHLEGLQQEYEFCAYIFPNSNGLINPVVAGVLGVPRGFGNPVVYGFGADNLQDRSIEKAMRECVQRLGFLWGEALPEREPQFIANAEYHQDFLSPAEHAVTTSRLA